MTDAIANSTDAKTRTWGLLAEYENVDALVSAAEKVRDAGFTRWESYSPFPVHGLDKAMGHKPTKLPWFVLVGGIVGGLTGLLLCWWTNATSFDLPYAARGYEFIVSGKPTFSLAANIPVIFELTILFSALTATIGMFAMNLLPRFHHPVFNSKRFKRVTTDRFFISIETADEKFDTAKTLALLEASGAVAIEELDDSE